jgi:hypothetical protein
MGSQPKGNASRSAAKGKKPKAERSGKKAKELAEKLEFDEIRPDPKIAKTVPYRPNERQPW